MRYSQIFPKTRRENPTGDTSPGTRLLIRAGFIHQVAAGIWVLTPLGLKVRRKVEAIIREEMARIGAIECELPILQPVELWQETGRLDKYTSSGTAFITEGRKGDRYILAPTAEEVITAFARAHVRSYRDLMNSLIYWQMSPKFRSELRPRQGLVRSREFLMKDAYSFDADEAGMRRSYDAMKTAYHAIFRRCGFLLFLAVEADSGSIGGSGSSEFMAVTECGEDVLLNCPTCRYGANQEKAVTRFTYPTIVNPVPMERLETPDIRTVDQLVNFMGIKPTQMVQTIVMLAGGKPVIISNRGDLEISEVKLANLLGVDSVTTAPHDVVEEVTGAPVGFAGPIGLYGREITYQGETVPYYFDHSVEGLVGFLCGGNEVDIHYTGVVPGRDFTMPTAYYDLTKVVEGQACPKCSGTLVVSHGIELGHIFQLQQVYSAPMNATFKDNTGASVPIWMGCFGIGVSRIVQTIVEQHYDAAGILWPVALAPYQILVGAASKNRTEDAEQVYQYLKLCFPDDVMLDDRGVSYGEMMTDADLIGYPVRIIVGRDYNTVNPETGMSEPRVEVSLRDTRDSTFFDSLTSVLDDNGKTRSSKHRTVMMTVSEFVSWWKTQLASGSAFTGNIR